MRWAFELERGDEFVGEPCDRIDRPIILADSAFAESWKIWNDEANVRQPGNNILEALVAAGEAMDEHHSDLGFWMVSPVADRRRFVEAYGLFHGLAFHHALMFTVLIALFDGLAFVVKFLTFTKRDDKLDIFPGRKELSRDDGHSLFAASSERVDLFT